LFELREKRRSVSFDLDGSLQGVWVTARHGARYLLPLVVTTIRFAPGHQCTASNGHSRSVTLATRVQKLLDSIKRRKFSMPQSLSRRGDVWACNPFQLSAFAEQACRKAAGFSDGT
jgi:hypothetical protein